MRSDIRKDHRARRSSLENQLARRGVEHERKLMPNRKTTALVAGLALLGALTAACASATTASTAGSSAPGKGTKAIGFIMVGPKDDFGYNQAVYEGSRAVKKAFPG